MTSAAEKIDAGKTMAEMWAGFAEAVRPMTRPTTGEEVMASDYEAWRDALIAFYERDELKQKADNLRRGYDLDYLDRRAIDALKAAFERIAA